MFKLFSLKLAISNLKRQRANYLPYFLAGIFTVILVFVMRTIADNPDLLALPRGRSMLQIMQYGNVAIAVFTFIFLFYANSFLMKNRMTELGLYNVLGMEKKHISKVLSWETILLSSLILVVGLVLGASITNLLFAIMLKTFQLPMSIRFQFSLNSLGQTLLMFMGIFLANLLFNLWQLFRFSPVKLLQSSEVGEKEPKARWLLAFIGLVCLFSGYWISLTITTPLVAVVKFFIAVILVIIGTYLTFITGSIAILNLLKKNKRFYYQSNHFVAISGMIYRMKQNAIGLANICILSTMVLITVGTTLSLYIGAESSVKELNPRDISIGFDGKDLSTEKLSETRRLVTKQAVESKRLITNERLEQSMGIFVFMDDSTVEKVEGRSWMSNQYLTFVSLDFYNQNYHQRETLKDDEILLYQLGNGNKQKSDSLKIAGVNYHIKYQIDHLTDVPNENIVETYLVVVKNPNVFFDIFDYYYGGEPLISTNYSFDVQGNQNEKLAFSKKLKTYLASTVQPTEFSATELIREEFYSIYGGFLFIGLVLGLTFTLATALIIYYKQMTEGIADQKRYIIMQEVGMGEEEVKQSIRSQILMIFFIPLAMAICHTIFAFPIIQKLLVLFGLTNVKLVILCFAGTSIVFLILYLVMFHFTSKMYYRLVHRK